MGRWRSTYEPQSLAGGPRPVTKATRSIISLYKTLGTGNRLLVTKGRAAAAAQGRGGGRDGQQRWEEALG